MQNKYCLHLDWDYPIPQKWFDTWLDIEKTWLKHLGFTLARVIVKDSPSRKGGKHLWLHILSPRKLTDEEINMLQWLSLDCPTRVWINQLRIERGLKKYWNKLFERHVWTKPLPEPCKKCRLRKYLDEMRKKMLKEKKYALFKTS